MGLAFTVGAVAAATLALFTAPKSGKEMRQDVKDKVEEGAKLAQAKTEVVVEQLGTVKTEGAKLAKGAWELAGSLKEKALRLAGGLQGDAGATAISQDEPEDSPPEEGAGIAIAIEEASPEEDGK